MSVKLKEIAMTPANKSNQDIKISGQSRYQDIGADKLC